jgi:hypothetical protein
VRLFGRNRTPGVLCAPGVLVSCGWWVGGACGTRAGGARLLGLFSFGARSAAAGPLVKRIEKRIPLARVGCPRMGTAGAADLGGTEKFWGGGGSRTQKGDPPMSPGKFEDPDIGTLEPGGRLPSAPSSG